MTTKIRRICQGVDVAPLAQALEQHPELWNQRTARTADSASPHHQVDDIWCRYTDSGTVLTPDPHDSHWYPEVIKAIPVQPLVANLMAYVQGERLGGVLITRVPAGKQVLPHVDRGWHAGYYEKFAIQLKSTSGQAFCFDDQQLESEPGDVYWFDNSFSHWVINPTEHDRITLIACIRPFCG